MSEMVRGIRTVKLQVWEPVWHARISAARNEEMKDGMAHVTKHRQRCRGD